MKRIKSVTVFLAVAAISILIFSGVNSNAGDAGEQVYNTLCTVCHNSGVMGAPKLGNRMDWAPRLAKGSAVLKNHALQGLNVMPPKGGMPTLSDGAVESAVDYMISAVD